MKLKKGQNREYEVTIGGGYYAMEGDKKSIKPYEVTVTMNEEHRKAGFLSVARNHVLGDVELMRDKYPDWKRFRSHELRRVRDLSNPSGEVTEPELMSLEQLIDYIEDNDLGVEVGLYANVTDLRKAIADCEEDPETFRTTQDKLRERKGGELNLKAGLKRLNPALKGSLTGMTTSVLEQPEVTPVVLNKEPETPKEKLSADPATGELVPIEEFTAEDLNGNVDDL